MTKIMLPILGMVLLLGASLVFGIVGLLVLAVYAIWAGWQTLSKHM